MDLFGEESAPEEEKVEPEEVVQPEPAEAFSHPRNMRECLGHEGVEAELIELFNSGHMPHALVFSGPQGIGKATMAFRMARFLLSKDRANTLDIDPNSTAFRLVASGGHPDLLSIERAVDVAKGKQKASVDVTEIRKVTPFLRKTASEGGWRVVIVDDADTMNRNAQNALLKILEEPPAKVLLILVAHRAGALIPTIRSRARVIPFQPLDEEIMRLLLDKQDQILVGDEKETLIHLSEGSFGTALRHIEEGGLQTLGKILAVLESYPNWDWPQIHVLADELARPGQESAFQTYCALMEFMSSQLLFAKARGGEALPGPLQLETLKQLLQNSSLEHLSKICENLREHFDTVQRANLDKRQGVLGAFSMMKAA